MNKQCEKCGYSIDTTDAEFDILICPNCGADMEEVEEYEQTS